ncbi:TRAP transporter small permease [Pelagibius marinus]|uniref:TRAP transporter small permease n=1 Tax=Pelagibius marinus TaxID=2762760 RepID=UPI00187247F7|nr:TRAP transporter small permease [Pelagibius marinus]
MYPQLVTQIEVAFKIAASALMAGLVAITFVDVIGRQFGAPISAAFELTQIAVGTMFYIALPFVTLRREHITVDLVPFMEDGPTGKAIGVAIDLLSTVLVGVAAWQLWVQADTLEMFTSVMMFLGWPLAPIVRVMAILTGLTAAVCLALAITRATSATLHPSEDEQNT